ncbi:hypothetical protein UNSW1_350 [Campylobacter concisus UNSW1]|nr:hypothetical protein [Campylobacter concisus]ERJ23199.1 hypothetical protein UNSW1_350 [Campylobacter concisus UNSW1]
MQLRACEVKPDDVQGGMLQCFALHESYMREFIANFKICENALLNF